MYRRGPLYLSLLYGHDRIISVSHLDHLAAGGAGSAGGPAVGLLLAVQARGLRGGLGQAGRLTIRLYRELTRVKR